MNSPIIYWIRRDLRLSDNPALNFAHDTSKPIIPIFICDQFTEHLGAAPKWRLEEGLALLQQAFSQKGLQLIFRRGSALQVLRDLSAQTGAKTVVWNRLYTPSEQKRDTEVKQSLKEEGYDAHSFCAHLMFEPWTVQTGSGSFYRVYSPFWKAVRHRQVEPTLPAPDSFQAFSMDLDSDTLSDWSLGKAMHRGLDIVKPYARIGETAARERLIEFMEQDVVSYNEQRDIPSILGTSGLSENLSLGEISPRQCWHAGLSVFKSNSSPGAETFLKELVWREFAYHLMYHTPHILDQNWRQEWDKFPWNEDETHPHVIAWKQGRTGVPFVDAAMRELYVTGRMHNRGRMIVASYLTKHLMTHWRIGQRWFEDCLIDWDPASNAMGWQWSAGSGPDATPYFRVFNAQTQLKKFDPNGRYVANWIAEISAHPTASALKYYDAIPKHWNLRPNMVYPQPIISMQEGRETALHAYKNRDF